ncbi:Crp/Fnr family transcriptional regulator [Flammeovirga kamogawensis]|uniref:Crp/Fnr family transcriptional regulator n=1 Tax=Flammeovirga kamogawensis TaxID=373891 RepID=A0ABX8H4U5_9BACT|nr:Crp/Fnr family transcriptional regulator [Flammeovirga kamogawensis]MBB6461813.1 CRP-like cAMP-binding protein [Flammeovirga kamogawensis]QWG10729.1 Crp/Fnr family transcriptional regulator [Flammeovirga kamogawensis]TRX63831.1 Crp/Fnr family transcriptional regulator [Flammeovirga kamogawensis]
MDELLNYIQSLNDFSTKSWEELQSALTLKTYAKNDMLLKEGEVCNALFYIVDGFCKSYYEVDGVVKNTGFFFENEIATNVNSFGTGEKSKFNISACSSLSTIVFDKKLLFELAKENKEIEDLGRNCLRVFATKQEEFLNLFSLYSPQERLEYIEKNYPNLILRVSLSQLSSFIGVSRETLSRIRKRRMES